MGSLVLFHGLAFRFDGRACKFTSRWKTTGLHPSKQKNKSAQLAGHTLSQHFPTQVSPHYIQLDPIYYAIGNPDVTLECITEAMPKAITYWVFNGTTVMTNGRYKTHEHHHSNYKLDLHLHIKNIKVWVATACPDLGLHANVCAPPIWSGRTLNPHFW